MKTIFSFLIFSFLVLYVLSFETGPFQDFTTMEFPPNQAISILNPLLWKVKVTCTVQSSDQSDVLIGKIIKGSATLNGQNLSDGTQIEVRSGDKLSITASGLGKFEITNLGQNTVITPCGLSYNLNFLEEEE